jgi:hypothetical protein
MAQAVGHNDAGKSGNFSQPRVRLGVLYTKELSGIYLRPVGRSGTGA